MHKSPETVLVLGANGRFGLHTALAFAAAGWRVLAQIRPGKPLNPALLGQSNIEPLPQALSDIAKLTVVANNSKVIVNGLHPPYRSWHTEIPKITSLVVSLARESGASVILPGNVYVYGATMPELLTASTPHHPTNKLGEIRLKMERQYRDAADDGVRTILLRIGDFLQRESTGNWFDTHMTRQLGMGRFAYPGRRTIPHAFGYLPDAARACVGLAQLRNDLPAFADIPFAGTTLSGDQMQQMIEQALGAKMKAGHIPWPVIRLLALFNSDMRGVVDMRYLWDTPHRLSDSNLRKWLPDFRPTPVEKIIEDCVSRFAQQSAIKNTTKDGLHQPLTVRH
ncbi:MAG: hypothetical protein ABJH63_20520 [Rhizobiaceae bacterium]